MLKKILNLNVNIVNILTLQIWLEQVESSRKLRAKAHCNRFEKFKPNWINNSKPS